MLLARGLVALVPFARWHARLGLAGAGQDNDSAVARRLAVHVERGAWRLGLPLKCLPRAMALSWMLRRRRIAHRVVIAARAQGQRTLAGDALHAWVEAGGETVLGALDGPWMVILECPGHA